MTKVITTPRRFGCPQHDRDLTAAVKSKIVAEPTVVTSLGFQRSTVRSTRSWSFKVDVNCSGGPDGAGAHVKRFRGSYEIDPSDDPESARAPE